MENETKKNKKPDITMEKSGKEFKAVNTRDVFKEKKEKTSPGFGKTVALPFLCGILGASLVIGTCFGVPEIRNNLIGESDIGMNSKNTTEVGTINTNLISLSEYSETGVAVAQKVLPSIVGITVEYSVNSIFTKQSSTSEASGSGIIISEDGYILTNNHVVNSASTSTYYEIGEANKVSVYLYNDQTEYEAKIIGTDAQTDLAVIKIDKTGLTAAELGDSDKVQVGEFSMAVGNPLGMQSSVTSGTISAVNRDITDSDGMTYTLMQTDTAINSGNSGGALVNSKGQVIGVNMLKVSATGVEGMGFAIPINTAKPIYEELKEYSKVKRPYIGIGGRDLDAKTAEYYNMVQGIYVTQIEEYSAAEKAGIKIGDIIIKADNQDIKTMDELNSIKNKHSIGDVMTVTISRNNKEETFNITLTEQP